MKFFLSFLFWLLLFETPQGSTLPQRGQIRALNTTLKTNFNGKYERKNSCTDTAVETSSYVASHELHHHTKEDDWSHYTHKCSAIISNFLRSIGNLIRSNHKLNGSFNFYLNTSISQKQDFLDSNESCDSLPTIVIEATECKIPINPYRQVPENQNQKNDLGNEKNQHGLGRNYSGQEDLGSRNYVSLPKAEEIEEDQFPSTYSPEEVVTLVPLQSTNSKYPPPTRGEWFEAKENSNEDDTSLLSSEADYSENSAFSKLLDEGAKPEDRSPTLYFPQVAQSTVEPKTKYFKTSLRLTPKTDPKSGTVQPRVQFMTANLVTVPTEGKSERSFETNPNVVSENPFPEPEGPELNKPFSYQDSAIAPPNQQSDRTPTLQSFSTPQAPKFGNQFLSQSRLNEDEPVQPLVTERTEFSFPSEPQPAKLLSKELLSPPSRNSFNPAMDPTFDMDPSQPGVVEKYGEEILPNHFNSLPPQSFDTLMSPNLPPPQTQPNFSLERQSQPEGGSYMPQGQRFNENIPMQTPERSLPPEDIPRQSVDDDSKAVAYPSQPPTTDGYSASEFQPEATPNLEEQLNTSLLPSENPDISTNRPTAFRQFQKQPYDSRLPFSQPPLTDSFMTHDESSFPVTPAPSPVFESSLLPDYLAQIPGDDREKTNSAIGNANQRLSDISFRSSSLPVPNDSTIGFPEANFLFTSARRPNEGTTPSPADAEPSFSPNFNNANTSPDQRSINDRQLNAPFRPFVTSTATPQTVSFEPKQSHLEPALQTSLSQYGENTMAEQVPDRMSPFDSRFNSEPPSPSYMSTQITSSPDRNQIQIAPENFQAAPNSLRSDFESLKLNSAPAPNFKTDEFSTFYAITPLPKTSVLNPESKMSASMIAAQDKPTAASLRAPTDNYEGARLSGGNAYALPLQQTFSLGEQPGFQNQRVLTDESPIGRPTYPVTTLDYTDQTDNEPLPPLSSVSDISTSPQEISPIPGPQTFASTTDSPINIQESLTSSDQLFTDRIPQPLWTQPNFVEGSQVTQPQEQFENDSNLRENFPVAKDPINGLTEQKPYPLSQFTPPALAILSPNEEEPEQISKPQTVGKIFDGKNSKNFLDSPEELVESEEVEQPTVASHQPPSGQFFPGMTTPIVPYTPAFNAESNDEITTTDFRLAAKRPNQGNNSKKPISPYGFAALPFDGGSLKYNSQESNLHKPLPGANQFSNVEANRQPVSNFPADFSELPPQISASNVQSDPEQLPVIPASETNYGDESLEQTSSVDPLNIGISTNTPNYYEAFDSQPFTPTAQSDNANIDPFVLQNTEQSIGDSRREYLDETISPADPQESGNISNDSDVTLEPTFSPSEPETFSENYTPAPQLVPEAQPIIDRPFQMRFQQNPNFVPNTSTANSETPNSEVLISESTDQTPLKESQNALPTAPLLFYNRPIFSEDDSETPMASGQIGFAREIVSTTQSPENLESQYPQEKATTPLASEIRPQLPLNYISSDNPAGLTPLTASPITSATLPGNQDLNFSNAVLPEEMDETGEESQSNDFDRSPNNPKIGSLVTTQQPQNDFGLYQTIAPPESFVESDDFLQRPIPKGASLREVQQSAVNDPGFPVSPSPQTQVTGTDDEESTAIENRLSPMSESLSPYRNPQNFNPSGSPPPPFASPNQQLIALKKPSPGYNMDPPVTKTSDREIVTPDISLPSTPEPFLIFPEQMPELLSNRKNLQSIEYGNRRSDSVEYQPLKQELQQADSVYFPPNSLNQGLQPLNEGNFPNRNAQFQARGQRLPGAGDSSLGNFQDESEIPFEQPLAEFKPYQPRLEVIPNYPNKGNFYPNGVSNASNQTPQHFDYINRPLADSAESQPLSDEQQAKSVITGIPPPPPSSSTFPQPTSGVEEPTTENLSESSQNEAVNSNKPPYMQSERSVEYPPPVFPAGRFSNMRNPDYRLLSSNPYQTSNYSATGFNRKPIPYMSPPLFPRNYINNNQRVELENLQRMEDNFERNNYQPNYSRPTGSGADLGNLTPYASKASATPFFEKSIDDDREINTRARYPTMRPNFDSDRSGKEMDALVDQRRPFDDQTERQSQEDFFNSPPNFPGPRETGTIHLRDSQNAVPYDFRVRPQTLSSFVPPDAPLPGQEKPLANPLFEAMESHMVLPIHEHPYPPPGPRTFPRRFDQNEQPSVSRENHIGSAVPPPSPEEWNPQSTANFANSQDFQANTAIDSPLDVPNTPQPNPRALFPDQTIPSNGPGEDHVSCCGHTAPLLCPFDPIFKGNMTAPSYYILVSKLPVDTDGEEHFRVEKVYLGDGIPINCTWSEGKAFPKSLYTPVPYSASNVVKLGAKIEFP